MALVALVALVVALPLYTFSNVGSETTTTEAVPAPSTPLPKGTTSNGRASIGLRISGAGARTAVASGRGRFVLRMGYRDPCASLSITAVGSKGSRASLNFSQLYCAAP